MVDIKLWVIMNKNSKVYVAGHKGLVGSAIVKNLSECIINVFCVE